MSLPDLPANESLLKFGMPWHGLYVKPPEEAPYIELANGRRIFSERFLADHLLFPSTYLLDIGLPAPDMQIDDADADFWNKAILSQHGYTPGNFSAWCMTSTQTRMVKTEEGFRYLLLESITPPTASFPSNITAYLYTNPANRLDYVTVANTGVADPSKVLSANHQQVDVLDVTPDGRKWLFSFSRQPNLTVYPYRYYIKGEDTDYGIGALVEVEFSTDFTSAASRVVADFNDCIAGRNFTFSDGDNFSSGSMAVGDPPQQIDYVMGTSVATATKTYVVGGWYSPAGELQLVRLRMTRTNSLIIAPPVSRSDMEQYWSPATSETVFGATYQVGSGAISTVMNASLSSHRSPMRTTYSLSILGKEVNKEHANLPVDSSDPIRGEIANNPVGEVHGNPAVAGGSTYIAAGWSMGFVFQCDWPESNKVISCLARYQAEPEGEFEYLTSRAATPSGMVGSTASTGNIVPGHDRYAENFDPGKWQRVDTFALGSYNPVTHQIERQRLGGASFTWV